jgi:predicted TIM-barrel fold metal-dependent hydrolase
MQGVTEHGQVGGAADCAFSPAPLRRAGRKEITHPVPWDSGRLQFGVPSRAGDPAHSDPFLAMVSATARVVLPLSDYDPQPCLRVPAHEVLRPAVPAVDAHCHVDSQPLDEVARIMDAAGIETMVNISLAKEGELDAVFARHRTAPRGRFVLFVLADWDGWAQGRGIAPMVEMLERRVAQGARGLKVWKDLGLRARDAGGRLLRADDERFAPLFAKAAELGIPVMLHLGDPAAFFTPVDARNERYEELAAHPDWSFYGPQYPAWEEILAQQARLIARHPQTRFIGAHMGGAAEELARVSAWLDRFPNFAVDISARAAELGRQPRAARALFLRHPERILFGSDLLPSTEMYRLYYRFLQTEDEYFPYPTHGSGQGRWRIYGLGLPPNVLERIYATNAREWIPALRRG